jgi:glycosyltransferase involved in cell wall biosynthesis
MADFARRALPPPTNHPEGQDIVTDDNAVSIVVATRNRCKQAYAQAQWALAQPACAEAIFVVDGTDDDTVPQLRHLAATDARLRVMPLDRQAGLCSARNVGIQAASSEWVLLIDDDDIASDGYIEAMLRVAHAAGASIVGTPWFNLTDGQDLATFIATAPRRPGGPGLDRPDVFPEKDWEVCLWINANVLFHRAVFDEISFDEGYRGNFYREETDFFVAAARAGHRVVVTSLAYTYLQERVGGGTYGRWKLPYEYWVLRNNWRFLRKHGAWLRAEGLMRGILREQVALAASRARPILRAGVRRLTPQIIASTRR